MAVQYVKVKRTINVGNNPGEKFLARLKRAADVSMDQIASDISLATTISYPDVLACLKALEIYVSGYIQSGQAVKFDYLGAFIPSISATAMNSADEVKSNTIKRFKCRFYPSVEFKRTLAKCKYELADLDIQGLQS